MGEHFEREHLADLYEEAPCGFLLTTLDGVICRANRTFIRWTQEADGAIVGRNIRELLSPASKLFYDTHFAAVLQAGRASGISLEIARTNAEALPVLVTSTVKERRGAGLSFLHSTFFDASERRDSERALVAAKRRADALADVVRSSPNPVLTVDYDLNLQTWNAAASSLLQDEMEFAVGFCLTPTLTELTHAVLVECMETEQPVKRQIQLRNGTVCQLSAYPMTDGLAIYLVDITQETETQNALKIAHDELHKAHDRFTLATMATTDGIWDWNCETNVVYLSGRAQAMCGYDLEAKEMPMRSLLRRFHPKDLARLREDRRGKSGSGARFETEWRIRHRDGTWRWVQSRGMSLRTGDGQLSRMVGSLTDVTGRKTEDPLTRLHTRLSLLDRLEWRLSVDERFAHPCALLFADVDAFKKVNDGLGHAAGDTLISEIADRLRTAIASRPASMAARLGGDEFVVLLEEVSSERDVRTFCEHLQHSLQRPVLLAGQPIAITASIGIALNRPVTTSAEDLLRNADLAMYRAKSMGKNRAVLFTAEMQRAAHKKLTLEADLRQAVGEKELELYYQPKVDLTTGCVVGYEALGRWKHPVHGMVSPDLFIAIAEDSNLIREIGRWTIREAIRQLAVWRRSGAANPTTSVSINLSPKQFEDSDLLKMISSNLAEYDVPARCVHFEVTEGVLISDVTIALSVLKELKGIGVGLELDDFGKGYSSLSYLHRYPFDSLKVDKSFVATLGKQEDSNAIVQTIIALAEALGLTVIAEGIETREQHYLLRDMGCELGQGFLFSRPMPPSFIEQTLLVGQC